MNPERWRKISEVFEAALRVDPASRESVLQKACAGDPELRAEVERLLACDAEVRAEGFLSFLDRGGAAAVMNWLPGDLTGPGPSRNGTHVLDSIAATIGTVPRVLLRDTTPEEAPSPMVKASSPEMPDGAARLQLFGEIARGGMGVVLKGRDPDLGRELAVKVLLEGGDPG